MNKDFRRELLDKLQHENPSDVARLITSVWDCHDPDKPWEEELYLECGKRMLKFGQTFLGYDILDEGLRFYPGNVVMLQQKALALARLGDPQEAQRILLPLYKQGNTDPDTIGILARTYKDFWQKTRDERKRQDFLKLARKVYKHGFEINQEDEYTGINAASMSLLLGEFETGKQLASQVIKICQKKLPDEKKKDKRYWLLASLGEAYLNIKDYAKVADFYKKAFFEGEGMYGDQATTIRQARLLIEYLKVNTHCQRGCFDELETILTVGNVVLCVGHMIDHPERAEPRFPLALEPEIRERIKVKLDELNVKVGYCSATCGTDILFAEEMLDRKAEVHIYLPFRREDFIETSVRFADQNIQAGEMTWVKRFHAVLKKATSVIEPVNEAYLGDECLFEYGNEVLIGKTFLHADTLGLAPHLLAVWNGKPGDRPFGTADVVNLWKKRYGEENIHIIDISTIAIGGKAKTSAPVEKLPSRPLPKGPEDLSRKIRPMLFADVVGFSKLLEAQIPYFMHEFMGAVGSLIQSEQFAPTFKNTWGDGLFCIFRNVADAAHFALELRDLVLRTNWQVRNLPEHTNIRIALHAGPVYSGVDLVAERLNYFGSHVSRSARLEPITKKGRVYVSEPFAALLRAENVADVVCEYIGQQPLAKDYGVYPVYLLRRVDEIG